MPSKFEKYLDKLPKRDREVLSKINAKDATGESTIPDTATAGVKKSYEGRALGLSLEQDKKGLEALRDRSKIPYTEHSRVAVESSTTNQQKSAFDKVKKNSLGAYAQTNKNTTQSSATSQLKTERTQSKNILAKYSTKASAGNTSKAKAPENER